MGDRIIFDHYSLCQREDGSPWELGRGAMGVTYKAMDVNLQFLVALKVINSAVFEDEIYRKRFVKEARAAARLRHPNIASVHHLGSDDTHYYYAMEFIDGETAQALVARHGPMPPPTALRVARQVAQALGAAARLQLVHRDIKPSNLMILADPEEDWQEEPMVKVIDFGLVRSALPGNGSTILTRNGFVGTPHYASPEQIEERELDARSDIYSLGCVLWFLLLGRPPFAGSVMNIFSQHLHDEPRWKDLRAFPRSVKTLLAHMLRKDPAERPQTPREVREEIDACLETLPPAKPTASKPALLMPSAMSLILPKPSPPTTISPEDTQPTAAPFILSAHPLICPVRRRTTDYRRSMVIGLAAVAVAVTGIAFAWSRRQPEPVSMAGTPKPPDAVIPVASTLDRQAPSAPLSRLETPTQMLDPAPKPIAPIAPVASTDAKIAAGAEVGGTPLAVNEPWRNGEKLVAKPSDFPPATPAVSGAEASSDAQRAGAKAGETPASSPGGAQAAAPAGAEEASPGASPSPAAEKRTASKRSRPSRSSRRTSGARRQQRGFNPLRTITEFIRRHL